MTTITDQDQRNVENLAQEINNRVDNILQMAKIVPCWDSDEGDKLKDTIVSSSIPTFSAATKTVMGGRGASFAMDAMKSSVQSLHKKIEALVFVLAHGLEGKIVLEDAASFSQVSLTLRKDLIFSHSLVSLLTVFSSNINRKINDEAFLNQLAAIGYLAQFERYSRFHFPVLRRLCFFSYFIIIIIIIISSLRR